MQSANTLLTIIRERGKRTRPLWMQRMATRQRKTLVVCRTCHQAIHYGQPTRQEGTIQATGERSALKGARSVRRGLRHDVAYVAVMAEHKPHITRCATTATLPGRAA
jgi:hypothetical protein